MSIFINDIGTIIRLRITNKDLTNGVNPRIYYKSPSGIQGSWVATIEDTNLPSGDIVTDVLQYIFNSGDLSESGVWQIQGYIELPAWSGFTTIETIKVEKDLSV